MRDLDPIWLPFYLYIYENWLQTEWRVAAIIFVSLDRRAKRFQEGVKGQRVKISKKVSVHNPDGM